jgi:hypothetical protein
LGKGLCCSRWPPRSPVARAVRFRWASTGGYGRRVVFCALCVMPSLNGPVKPHPPPVPPHACRDASPALLTMLGPHLLRRGGQPLPALWGPRAGRKPPMDPAAPVVRFYPIPRRLRPTRMPVATAGATYKPHKPQLRQRRSQVFSVAHYQALGDSRPDITGVVLRYRSSARSLLGCPWGRLAVPFADHGTP